MVEGVQDYAIYMLDPEGIIQSWNTGAQILKGYSAAEAIGRHFSMFYRPEELALGMPENELRIALEKAGRKKRAGGSARTAPGSGPMSSSPPSGTPKGSCAASPKSPATCPSAGGSRN